VTAVTVTDRIPLDLYGSQSTTIAVPSGTPGGGDAVLPAQYAGVDEHYFDALGIRILRGHALDAAAVASHAAVAVVSDGTARRLWPGVDPVGREMRVGMDGPLVRVVGVAADVKVQTLGEAPPLFFYQPGEARRSRLLRVVGHTSGDAATLLATMRRTVAELDPRVAVFEAKTMARHVDLMLFPYRAAASVSTILGLFGLLLASIGLYGVVAFGVARRTREFGLRIALGATAGSVLQLVMRESLRTVLVAVALGLLLSFGVGRLMASVLFGVGAADPVAFGGVAVALVSVALLATLVPALRATRIQPSVALREE
jgi:putative ABC transport system permease protein